MKKSNLILLVLVFIAVLAAAALLYSGLSDRYVPEEGGSNAADNENTPSAEQAPDFTVTDAQGNKISLSDFTGKPVVINFWATWCYPCKSELPAFDSVASDYGEDAVFLMVNLTDGARDTVDGVRKFVDDNGYSFPVYFDTEYSAANAYGVYSVPMTVLIAADGSLADKHIGKMSEAKLVNYVESLIGGTSE